jgi:hypothetical protein
VSEIENYKVVLYLTGRKYAAENLNEILNHRDHTDPPIVSSDAASTNNIHDHLVIKALCNVHSRRNFFDLGERFKEESEKVLDLLKTVFKYERETKEGEFSGEQRLAYHQEKSLPLMNELKLWMDLMIEEKKTEPNSSLGQAISYCQKNWQDLMAFTRIANAPLHNNLVEERLRQVVINRKNWNFYKTQLGALVGDIILCMIKTAEENGVNAFDYLVWVQENQAEVIKNPNLFFPWNFVKATPV